MRADGIQLHKGVVSHLVDLLVIGLDLFLETSQTAYDRMMG